MFRRRPWGGGGASSTMSSSGGGGRSNAATAVGSTAATTSSTSTRPAVSSSSTTTGHSHFKRPLALAASVVARRSNAAAAATDNASATTASGVGTAAAGLTDSATATASKREGNNNTRDFLTSSHQHHHSLSVDSPHSSIREQQQREKNNKTNNLRRRSLNQQSKGDFISGSQQSRRTVVTSSVANSDVVQAGGIGALNLDDTGICLVGRKPHFETLRRAIIGGGKGGDNDSSGEHSDDNSDNGNVTTILVHGNSGTGKSRLVKEFVDSLQQQEATKGNNNSPTTTILFGTGKFDQYRHDSGGSGEDSTMLTTSEPFEAILKALTSIVSSLVESMTPAECRPCRDSVRQTMLSLLSPAQRLLLEDLIPLSVNLWRRAPADRETTTTTTTTRDKLSNPVEVLEREGISSIDLFMPSALDKPPPPADDVDEWLSHTVPRITLALRSFLRALLQVPVPSISDGSNGNDNNQSMMRIIVFLDDLQWAEDSAMKFIADLLSAATHSNYGFSTSTMSTSWHSSSVGSSSRQYGSGSYSSSPPLQQQQQPSHQFVLIGAYRDNDNVQVRSGDESSTTTPPMIAWLERQLSRHSAQPPSPSKAPQQANHLVKVRVDNLTFEDTNEMVSTLIHVPLAKTQELAQVIYRKTNGNAFFVARFLELLQHEKLLYFSMKTCSWEWDLASITSETNVTENVVQLLQHQISRQPLEHQSVLKLAACLGFYFDVRILREIVLREGLLGGGDSPPAEGASATTTTTTTTVDEPMGVSSSLSSLVATDVSSELQPPPFIPTGQPFAHFSRMSSMDKSAAIVDVADDSEACFTSEADTTETRAAEKTPPLRRRSSSMSDLKQPSSEISNSIASLSRPTLARATTTTATVDVVTRRLTRRADSTKHFRAIMTSRYRSLTNVKDRSENQAVCAAWLVSILGHSEKEGLIERASDTQYKFSHDGVQRCLYEMTPQGQERDMLHLRIGRLVRDTYLVKLTEEGSSLYNDDLDEKKGVNRSQLVVDSLPRPGNQSDEVDEDDNGVWTSQSAMLFVAVAQLNKAAQYIRNRKERIGLVELNLESSYRAKEQSAFLAASRFLRHAVALIQDEGSSAEYGSHDFWETHYSLCLEVFSSSAEAEYSCGHFTKALETVDHILIKGRTFPDKLRAIFVKINSLGVQRQLQEAINESCKALASAEIGEAIPRRAGTFSVMSELVRTKKSLRGLTCDDLLNLPNITDPMKRAAMRILNSLALFAWHAAEESLLTVVFFRLMRITLLHGQCQWTPFAYASFGMLLAAYGDSKTASDFGQLALDMVHCADSAIALPRTYLIVYTFIYHIRRPLHLCVEPLLQAHRVGLETGELEYGSLAMSSYAALYVICGLPLSNFSSDMRTITEQLEHFGQNVALTSISPWWQLAMNLMGESESVVELSGEAIANQEQFQERVARSAAEPTFYLIRLVLYYLFDELDSAHDMYTKLQEGHRKTISGTHFIDHLELLYSGLLMFRLSKDKTSGKAGKCKRQAKKHVQSLDKLVKQGAVNCHMMLIMLQAEEAATTPVRTSFAGNASSSEQQEKKVKHMYDAAIASLARSGFTHLQAVANERIGLYMMEKGDMYWAETYLLQAMRSYAEWGAVKKLERLRQQHSVKLAKLGDPSNLGSQTGTAIKGRPRFNVLPAPNKQ